MGPKSRTRTKTGTGTGTRTRFIGGICHTNTCTFLLLHHIFLRPYHLFSYCTERQPSSRFDPLTAVRTLPSSGTSGDPPSLYSLVYTQYKSNLTIPFLSLALFSLFLLCLALSCLLLLCLAVPFPSARPFVDHQCSMSKSSLLLGRAGISSASDGLTFGHIGAYYVQARHYRYNDIFDINAIAS